MPAAPPSPPPAHSVEGSPPRNGVTAQRHQDAPMPTRRSPKDFIFGRSIGEGSFSNVYLAKDIHSRKEYASENNIYYFFYDFIFFKPIRYQK